MIGPTPLLDFFKRGEVERDVRLEAAQGALTTRAYEQIAILALLVEDPDREIRDAAEETLSRIPRETLAAFLGRSDTPLDLREFFGDRGIFPDEIAPVVVDAEEPLVAPTVEEDFGDEDEDRRNRHCRSWRRWGSRIV